MSAPRQRTLAGPVTVEGTGLHCGASTSVTLKPADPGTGFLFRRTDLDGEPVFRADLDHVLDTHLGTTIGAGEVRVRTVEHLLAALSALQVDNVLVDVTGPEVPILDGSFRGHVEALDQAGIVEQSAEAHVLTITEPVSMTEGGSSTYVAAPGAGVRVSATIAFDHPMVGRQYGSFAVDENAFRTELAPARTFGFRSDAEALHARGLALGASLENTVVLDEDRVLNEDLRFEDEFLRHKIGDVVGDLALLGTRLNAHIVAERPSHSGNVALARALRARQKQQNRTPQMDITQIMQFLPHRYPMLLVDRILEVEEGERIVGLKNVTINEPFFQGHYPGRPIMPGVLIVEAMAQCGGLLLMDRIEDPQEKVVLFMTIDGVKFRRPVVPGDTLRFELEVVQFRRDVCKMKGKGFVEGAVAAEAEFMAKVADK